MRRFIVLSLMFSTLVFMSLPATADTFFFSTGDPDGKIATASRPSGAFEIESADDFVTTAPTTHITSATFTGLIPMWASVNQVVIEIYRVFPADSTNPPSGNVPTRVNSPSDMAFASRDSAAGELNFTTSLLGDFTVNNSVQPGGIHPIPNQTTGGDGAVTGEEVQFSVNFNTPFDLAADHYFFVPQVLLDSGDFLWLSAPRPIVPPGTPFLPDLQSWTRDQFLAPDWLRIGSDIVGGTPAPTFNAAFTLSGTTVVPLPGALPLLGTGLIGLALYRRWRRAI